MLANSSSTVKLDVKAGLCLFVWLSSLFGLKTCLKEKRYEFLSKSPFLQPTLIYDFFSILTRLIPKTYSLSFYLTQKFALKGLLSIALEALKQSMNNKLTCWSSISSSKSRVKTCRKAAVLCSWCSSAASPPPSGRTSNVSGFISYWNIFSKMPKWAKNGDKEGALGGTGSCT